MEKGIRPHPTNDFRIIKVYNEETHLRKESPGIVDDLDFFFSMLGPLSPFIMDSSMLLYLETKVNDVVCGFWYSWFISTKLYTVKERKLCVVIEAEFYHYYGCLSTSLKGTCFF